mmetsp:Transcript_9449/g.18975  ORF Transcript_9449/g.18975 Transcript_9449/m.18975 type:complete len:378 (+) Transcript_9449:13-1146(+)
MSVFEFTCLRNPHMALGLFNLVLVGLQLCAAAALCGDCFGKIDSKFRARPPELLLRASNYETETSRWSEWDSNDEESLGGINEVKDGAASGGVDNVLEMFLEAANEGFVTASDEKLGAVDSHELMEFDSNGAPILRPGHKSFTFVDELACIGCTLCVGAAPSTFFMEPEHGQARVYQQHGDAAQLIEKAMACCPVNCIHPVPDFAHLTRLEERRHTHRVNKKARLVGGDAPRDDRPLGLDEFTAKTSARALARALADPTDPNRWDDDDGDDGDVVVVAKKNENAMGGGGGPSRKEIGNAPLKKQSSNPTAAVVIAAVAEKNKQADMGGGGVDKRGDAISTSQSNDPVAEKKSPVQYGREGGSGKVPIDRKKRRRVDL